MWLELLVAAVVLLGIHLYLQLRRPEGFPPGPPVLPIFGSLPFLPISGEESPTAFHDSLATWAKRYGPVYSMALGHTWIVILNDYQSLKEAMIEKGTDFAGRPVRPLAKIYNPYYPIMGIAGNTYTRQWDHQHKSFQDCLHLLQDHCHDIITEEATQISLVLKNCIGKVTDIQKYITYAATNISVNLFFGEHYDYKDKNFEALHQTLNEAIGSLFIGNAYIPGGYLTPSHRKLSIIVREKFNKLNDYIHKKVNECHHAGIKEKPSNLAEAYLALVRKDPHLEDRFFQSVHDMFIAFVNSTHTLNWCIYFMVAHPEIQRKVQEELDAFSNRDQPIHLDARAALPYTHATLLENLRLSCVVPTTIPHLTVADTKVGNYFIPKGTEVWGNIWHIHRDPDIWPDPLSFKPERFLDDKGRIIRKEDIAPFGLGLRACLGEDIAWQEIFLIFTRLMRDFSLGIPDGHTLPPPVGKLHITHGPPTISVSLRKRN